MHFPPLRHRFRIEWRIVFTIVAILAASGLKAAILSPVRFVWNANPEQDIAGYALCLGLQSGKPTRVVHAGLNTGVWVVGLKEDTTYYVTVSAFNRRGILSKPSAELVFRRSAPQPPDGRITSPSTDGTVVAGQIVNFAASSTTGVSFHWTFGAGSGVPDSPLKNPGPVRFYIPGTYQVTLTTASARGLLDVSPDVRTIRVIPEWEIVPSTGWTLKYVNSEEPQGFAATQAFDGNPSTFWHTKWRAKNLPPPPHQIQIDMKNSRWVKGFQYLPRQDGVTVGTIGRYAFYVSADGKNWGKPVATGNFAASTTEKRVFCTAKKGRYVRLVGLSEVNGNRDCSVAELKILQGPPPNRKPSASAGSATTSYGKSVRIVLKGKDPDGNPLVYQIKTRPRRGTLSGEPPNLTYKPDKGFSGTDVFNFVVNDGTLKSTAASFQIRVKSKPLSAPASAAAAPALAASVISGPAAPASLKKGVQIIDGLKYLTLTVPQPASAERVQVSPDLVEWFSGARHVTVLSDNPTFLKVRDNTPMLPGRKRHIRYKSPSR